MLLEVLAVPFQMNNETILDGKCPPGWTLVQDTCFIYVGAPMTFQEARDFCRSENSTMPFIRTDSTTLWKYLQSQMRHLKYPEKVWIQDYNHIERCTSFVFSEIEVGDCQKERGFICEMDPRVGRQREGEREKLYNLVCFAFRSSSIRCRGAPTFLP